MPSTLGCKVFMQDSEFSFLLIAIITLLIVLCICSNTLRQCILFQYAFPKIFVPSLFYTSFGKVYWWSISRWRNVLWKQKWINHNTTTSQKLEKAWRRDMRCVASVDLYTSMLCINCLTKYQTLCMECENWNTNQMGHKHLKLIFVAFKSLLIIK